MSRPSPRVRVRERQLARLFERILVVSAVPLSGAACSTAPARASEADAQVAVDPCAQIDQGTHYVNLDGGKECLDQVLHPCGIPVAILPIGRACTFSVDDCQTICSSFGAFRCQAAAESCPSGVLARTGPVTIECDWCAGSIGRRPRGLVPAEPRARARSVVGTYLARAAHLEAASVRAFDELSASLVALGAPAELHDAARRAGRDEVRHARDTARLARRFGASRLPVQSAASDAARSVEDLAIENAVEGCVRETYGALVARWQAEHADDVDVAALMHQVARDETRHAALAWAIADWAASRLDEPARRRVARAREAAWYALRDECAEPLRELVRYAGVPTRVEQEHLFSTLHRALRSSAA